MRYSCISFPDLHNFKSLICHLGLASVHVRTCAWKMNIFDSKKKQDQKHIKPTVSTLLPAIACKGIMGDWGPTGSE